MPIPGVLLYKNIFCSVTFPCCRKYGGFFLVCVFDEQGKIGKASRKVCFSSSKCGGSDGSHLKELNITSLGAPLALNGRHLTESSINYSRRKQKL
jgi:hypothetical protein